MVEATGKSILHFRKGKKTIRDFTIIKTGLELPKEELQQRINNRVDKMMADGLLDEIKSLLRQKSLQQLRQFPLL